MPEYRLQAEAAVEFDVASAFQWYETEEPGLGFEFLNQLRGFTSDYSATLTDIRHSVPEFAAR